MNLFDNIFNKRAKKRAQDEFAAALDGLGFPYEMLESGLSEAEIIERYAAELENGKTLGFFPVLAPYEPELFKLINRNREDGFGVKSALTSELAEGAGLFSSRLSESEISDAEYSEFAESDEGASLSEFISEGFSALDRFSLLFTEFTNSFRTSALIKLPTASPWRAVLYLPFGGWNECPAPPDMAAMLKVWHEKYGAVPAVFSGDALELFLPRPLDEVSRREAAKEIVAFSGLHHPKIDESSADFDELAKSLIGKKVWQFWWD